MKKGGMDRSSWIAAGACFLLLLLYPKIVAHFYPPNPAKKVASAQRTGTEGAPSPVSTPAQVLTPKETLAPGSDSVWIARPSAGKAGSEILRLEMIRLYQRAGLWLGAA